jgi:hypothetical protein
VYNLKFDPNSTEKEGRWRLKDPNEFEGRTIYRKPSLYEGIDYIMGKNKKDKKLEIQAIRFNRKIWSEKEAATWWEENKDKYERTWKDEEWKEE